MSHGRLLGAAVAATLAGCGSARSLPPAAEPAVSPPTQAPPAGRVVVVPQGPIEGLAFDSRDGLLAAGFRRSPSVGLLRPNSGSLVRLVPLPAAPRHLQLAGDGRSLLVPAERADALVTVRLPDGAVTRIGVGRFPHDAAGAGSRVFVGNEFGDSISVVERGRVLRTLRAPVQPGGVAAVDGRLAVVGVRERVVTLYDTRTLRTLGTVPAGVGPTHVVAGPAGRLYVVDTQGDALLDFRTRPRLEIASRVALPGLPYAVAADPARGRLWVTLTARNRLVRLRIRPVGPPRVVGILPTVRQPNSIAVDQSTGAVFVAGRRGELQIVSPELAARTRR